MQMQTHSAPLAHWPREAWQPLETAHRHRAEALTAGHRARKQRGAKHPIEDFLWTYYSVTPAELARWHPGAGTALEGVDRSGWRYYAPGTPATLDLTAYFTKRGSTVDYVERLLTATLERAPQFGCFGLHEWAMVYRLGPGAIRHAGLPLRLGHEASDHVVESHRIVCSHFDAYRFFTPEASPLNTLRPTRENQPDTEQAGCLHAGMDVYKWAAKLGPILPGEVLLDSFELARYIREVDMRASPYDVTGFTGADGSALTPIAIETEAGKHEYERLQRSFADRGNALRLRVLTAISAARVAAAGAAGATPTTAAAAGSIAGAARGAADGVPSAAPLP